MATSRRECCARSASAACNARAFCRRSPTIAEAGVPGFEVVQRSVLLAPAGTPRAIIERLNKELNAVLATDEVRQRLAPEAGEPIPGAPQAHRAGVDAKESTGLQTLMATG